MSWGQLEVAAKHHHRSGTSMAEHVKTYVSERLAQGRTTAKVERASGCMQELKKSFTLSAGGSNGTGRQRLSEHDAAAEPFLSADPDTSRDRLGRKLRLAAVPRPRASELEESPGPPVFFSTACGPVTHARAPGVA